MGKKKQLQSKSAAVEARRKKNRKIVSAVKVNPFEVRINKSKYAIIGRRLKHDRGLPGLSRSKAIKKRKQTLLQEYKNKGKTNTFVDKRFGEYNEDMSLEEKMLQRFTLEKQHHHEKAGLYNLNDDDDDELTHYGQSLGDIDNFDDADLKLTDDEEAEENIDESHFGGFLTKKEKTEEEDKEKTKSKKEIMEEIVAKSKLKKFERQQAQEEAFQLTQELDSEWNAVHRLLLRRDNSEEEKRQADDYDILVRQLMFESKAKPTERSKSEEEIAREERERLQKLEEERKQRMRGTQGNDEKRKHFSADDLGEGYKPHEDKRFQVRYKDGRMVLPDGVESLIKPSKPESENVETGSESDDEEQNDQGQIEEDQETDEEEDDDYSDVLSDTEAKDEAEPDESSAESESETEEGDNTSTDKRAEGKKLNKGSQSKHTDATVEKELPYTFKAPKNLQELLEIVRPWKYDEQLKIIERIRKCHHPKLAPENKRKMEKLFDVILDYIDYLANQKAVPLKFVNSLARPLFELASDSPHHGAVKIQRRFRRAFKRFWNKCQASGKDKSEPDDGNVVFFFRQNWMKSYTFHKTRCHYAKSSGIPTSGVMENTGLLLAFHTKP